MLPLPHSSFAAPASSVPLKQEERTGGDVIPAEGARELCTLLGISIFLAQGEAGGAERQRGGVGAVPGCPP